MVLRGAVRGGIAGSRAGWYCGKPCGVGRRDVMGRRAILPCSNGVIHEGFLAAIPKSGPEIKNHCTLEGVSRQNHAAIPKSGPEIKNHCSRGLVGSAGGPFFFAATKNRIGRGRSLPRRLPAGEPFYFAATRNRIRHERSLPRRLLQAKPFSFAATKGCCQPQCIFDSDGLKQDQAV